MSISRPAITKYLSMTSERAAPTTKKAIAVALADIVKEFSDVCGRMRNGMRGKAPAVTNDAKVASPSLTGLRLVMPALASDCMDLTERYFDAPIENPSAMRLAMPRTMMIVLENPPPAAPEMTAKVVMMPSFAPKTISPK